MGGTSGSAHMQGGARPSTMHALTQGRHRCVWYELSGDLLDEEWVCVQDSGLELGLCSRLG